MHPEQRQQTTMTSDSCLLNQCRQIFKHTIVFTNNKNDVLPLYAGHQSVQSLVRTYLNDRLAQRTKKFGIIKAALSKEIVKVKYVRKRIGSRHVLAIQGYKINSFVALTLPDPKQDLFHKQKLTKTTPKRPSKLRYVVSASSF